MSQCVMSTSLLVSTGASVVNLIWFANEKCLSCQLWADEIRHLAIQKLASSVC